MSDWSAARSIKYAKHKVQPLWAGELGRCRGMQTVRLGPVPFLAANATSVEMVCRLLRTHGGPVPVLYSPGVFLNTG